MPYDPDWDPDAIIGSDLVNDPAGGFVSPSPEHDANGYENEDGQEDRKLDVDSRNGNGTVKRPLISTSRIDPPRIPHFPSFKKEESVATPPSRLPFPGASAIRSTPQLEVVLHSSPRRRSFTSVDRPTQDANPETSLITSDIIPKPSIKREKPPIKAQVASKKPPPPAASVPKTPGSSTTSPQPRKRGRPFGWKPGHGSYAALREGFPPGMVPSMIKPKKLTGEQKVRRKPGRKPVPTARQLYLRLNPQFVVFTCEWKDCPARLQNMETLRKHLFIVHGRPSPSTGESQSTSFPCEWASCTVSPFPTLDTFKSHVETAHLLPYLWHVGDGPQNNTPSPSLSLPSRQPTLPHSTNNATTIANNNPPHPLPHYLFNAHGEQVTPSIHDQQRETDDDRRKRQARINRVVQQRDRNAPEEPDYTARELEIIGEVARAKRARQKMLGEYADAVLEGGVGGEGWKPY
ncbi:hypothetical protein B0J18DRAFT_431437 [Chaetomium sp. MPI-SDFR-AT-0129]|nr:hypothetical protein B0J18DRAFT_431437 [Chaetomium sp. MPI-SDFR-AT-0129]